MRVTSKGQVTIPQAIREAAGMPPGTEVTFHLDDDGRVRLEPSRDDRAAELRAAVEALRGRAGGRMTTEEIMVLTRG